MFILALMPGFGCKGCRGIVGISKQSVTAIGKAMQSASQPLKSGSKAASLFCLVVRASQKTD